MSFRKTVVRSSVLLITVQHPQHLPLIHAWLGRSHNSQHHHLYRHVPQEGFSVVLLFFSSFFFLSPALNPKPCSISLPWWFREGPFTLLNHMAKFPYGCLPLVKSWPRASYVTLSLTPPTASYICQFSVKFTFSQLPSPVRANMTQWSRGLHLALLCHKSEYTLKVMSTLPPGSSSY